MQKEKKTVKAFKYIVCYLCVLVGVHLTTPEANALELTSASGASQTNSGVYYFSWSFGGIGSCSAGIFARDDGFSPQTARVSLGGFYPEGTHFSLGNIANSNPITQSSLEACGLNSIENLTVDGADGSYDTDDYLGFSFRAKENATGNTYDYEYALSGVTDTVIISNRNFADVTPPTVSFSGIPVVSTIPSVITDAALFSIAVVFSESVTGFDVNDIILSNATASNFSGSDRVYYVDISPDGTGDINIDVAADVAQDGSSNGNVAATQATVLLQDTTSPTVAITAPGNFSGTTAFSATFNFSENVTGFEVSDITLANATASNFAGSGTTYTADITPDGTGDVSIDVAADVAQDGSSNGSVAASQATVALQDTTSPTVAITAPGNFSGTTAFSVTFTFSENVTGFEVGDITLSNATASNFAGSGATYTADIMPDGTGYITIDVAADVAQDGDGNGNTAASQVTVSFQDTTSPTVAITAPGNFSGTTVFSATFTFSENVTGFEVGDITLANATVSNFAGSGTTYTADVTPDGTGDITIDVAADVAQDASANGNIAAEQVVIAFGTPESEFAAKREAIVAVVQGEVRRQLSNDMAANRSLVNGAMGRFMRQTTEAGIDETVPFDVDGGLRFSSGTLSTQGTFFGSGYTSGGAIRTIAGNFNATRDDDGSVTGSLSGRVSWEYAPTDTTRVGYFLGGSISRSDIRGSFNGDGESAGVIGGIYGLARLDEALFGSAYAAVGHTRTKLSFKDATLSLDSDYGYTSFYTGFEVEGQITRGMVEIRPGVSLDYGSADIGIIDFDASAFGASSKIPSDMGDVSNLELRLTSEFLFRPSDEARTEFRVAPSFACSKITGQNSDASCGAGLGLGVSSTSEDGLRQFELGYQLDDLGGQTRNQASLLLEIQF